MRPKVRFQCLCLWLILGLASTDATAASFSARMTTTREGKTQTGTFFLQDQRYRMEVQENGHPVVVIADQAKNRHWIVNVMEANYFKIASDDFSVLSNDPFKTSDYIAAKYGIRSEGTETVAGFSCDRQQAQVQDTKVMTRWYASELDFPIKIIMHQGKQDAVVELTAIAQAPQKSELFIPPAGFKQVEEPGAAAKRKRREAEQQEAALAGLTAVGTGQVPCYVKVAAGGDLRVKLDSRRSAKVEVLNQIKEESRVNVLPFRNGQQVQNIGVAPWMLRGKGDQQNRDFNDSFAQNAKALLVDEVRIQVEQGLVYAAVSQKGSDRTDFYNRGHLQNGAATDPKKALAVQITGDNPFGPETTGKLLLIPQDGGASETVPFTVKTGQTASWKLASDRHIKGIRVIIKQGDGRAKITVDQTTATAAAAPTAAGAAATGAPAASPTRQPTRTAASAGGSTRQAPQTTASSDAAIPRMVLVLDASGSMWGQLQGEAKIAIAKKVMADLIATIPPSFQTGLTVYGHRRKGDCDDIEMIIPVGPHNAREMTAKVQAISPKGKTPLSAAVKQAAEALRYTEERATVVLVSDGLETCDIDPCELAAELAMSGVDFTVHVIGFDISVGDQERLRCLADKTGGLFLAADNAGSLRDALFKTVEKVQAPPPAVIEDPGTATLNGPASVPAGAAFQVTWQGPDSQRDYIAIAEKGSQDNRYRDYRYTLKGNPADFVAPGDVGDYELRYVHGHTRKVIGRTTVKVTPVQARVEVSPSADVATEIEVAWQGPAYKSDYISIARPDQGPGQYVNYTYTSKGSPLKVRAPSDPGTYEVRYILGRGSKLLAKTGIEIKAVGASVQGPPAADVATEFEVAWQGPNNKSDYISIARPDQGPGQYVNYTYTSKGSPLKVRAPSDPGTYEVRYILGRGSKLLAKTGITINAVTASVQAPASADMATEFEVAWQGPNNKSDYISIARPDQGPGQYVNYTYTSKGSPLKVRAPSDPGTYEVRYILGRGSKLLAKTGITINAVTARVACPKTAAVDSAIQVKWQGPGHKGDYICISRPDQKPGRYVNYQYTGKGNPLTVKAPKAPGAYEIRYILGRGKKMLASVPITIE
jgi:Ca-activated chloride channel family protein